MIDNNLSPIEWHVKKLSVKELKPWKKNPRKISKEALEKLKERIIARGFHDVIKIDTDNTILSGNQRKKVLEDLSVMEVIVLYPNRALTEEERNKVALESNTNDGEWDFELLKDFKLDTLLDIGFDSDELSSMWSDQLEVEDDEFDENEELEKIKNPVTKPGDLIELGNHRLYCGDSTNPEVLKKLLGNEKVSMIYSDPIYNINLDYNKGLGGKQNYGGNVVDKRTDEEYYDFLKKSLSSALLVSNPDVHVFYWNTEQHIWIIQTLYRELGIDNKRVCIWVKNGHNPTPKVAFNKCYEPVIYGTRGNPYLSGKEKGLNEIMNKEITSGNDSIDEINIWTAKRVSSKDYNHATTKPVELHEKAIRRCTKPGDIILDSFGGSGSTLIASEQLKRRAFLVELEPIFCDLIIRRFEKLTGVKAKIIRDEETQITK